MLQINEKKYSKRKEPVLQDETARTTNIYKTRAA